MHLAPEDTDQYASEIGRISVPSVLIGPSRSPGSRQLRRGATGLALVVVLATAPSGWAQTSSGTASVGRGLPPESTFSRRPTAPLMSATPTTRTCPAMWSQMSSWVGSVCPSPKSRWNRATIAATTGWTISPTRPSGHSWQSAETNPSCYADPTQASWCEDRSEVRVQDSHSHSGASK